MLDFTPYCWQFTPIPVLRTIDAVPLPAGSSQGPETPSEKEAEAPPEADIESE
jgi:hypothetical protein